MQQHAHVRPERPRNEPDDLAEWLRWQPAWFQNVWAELEHARRGVPDMSYRGRRIAAAHPTLPRVDLVTNVRVITGTPSPAPVPPRLPEGEHALALVHVPPGAACITSLMIKD